MSEQCTPILLVEDTPPLSRLYLEYLAPHPYEVTLCETGHDALARLEEQAFSAIVLDLQLPDINGLEILKRSKSLNPIPTTVVITANGSVKVAVEAMREGAYDFIVKPFDAERLTVTLANAIDHRQLSEIVETYKRNFDRGEYHRFVGSSLPMQAVYRMIESAAPSDAPVFVVGESGVGKELCAEAIHRESRRRDRPFMAINCAAIPKDLVESEMFGHIKGAFTGAVADRIGAVGRADGGTLFLDEICEMPIDMQPKLLRFLQTGTFNKVGSSETDQVDVRIVCATNRDPRREVAEGRFREDLFYRLHVVPIRLPPLRDREGDIAILAERFLTDAGQKEGKNFRGFAPDALDFINSYDWPGNVRELENVVNTAVVLNNGEYISRDMLPDHADLKPRADSAGGVAGVTAKAVAGAGSGGREVPPGDVDSHEAGDSYIRVPLGNLSGMERCIIEAALKQTGGNVPQAAASLQVSPSTIYRKMKGWENR